MACRTIGLPGGGSAIICGPKPKKPAWPKTGEQLKEAGYTSDKIWAKCKACPRPIVWAKTPNGRPMPLSRMDDGLWQPHWADCPAREQFKAK